MPLYTGHMHKEKAACVGDYSNCVKITFQKSLICVYDLPEQMQMQLSLLHRSYKQTPRVHLKFIVNRFFYAKQGHASIE